MTRSGTIAPTMALDTLPPHSLTREPIHPGAVLGNPLVLTVLALVIVVAIGVLDYTTGPEIGFSLFYLAPIAVVAWYAGSRPAVTVAVVAALCWFVADYLLRVSLGLSLWNGLTRFVIYVAQGVLIATLRRDRLREAELARTDSLTHLPNSRAFRESLHRRIDEGGDIALMYIDLDNFKRINDEFGHEAGDDVLERVAAVLHDAVGAGATLARLGGDEFAVLLPHADPSKAGALAELLIDRVAEIGRRYPQSELSASVGVTLRKAGSASVKELLSSADHAMYDAKQEGSSFRIAPGRGSQPADG